MVTAKKHIFWISVMALVVAVGCSTSKTGTATNPDEDYGGTTEVNVDNPSVTLADYLRRVPGVQVNGNGPSATILVRGTETMMGGSTTTSAPLFVLDGVKSGRNFARISSLVNMAEVVKIRVLKGVEASAGYGQQGGNGVIEIYTSSG